MTTAKTNGRSVHVVEHCANSSRCTVRTTNGCTRKNSHVKLTHPASHGMMVPMSVVVAAGYGVAAICPTVVASWKCMGETTS